MSAKLNTGKIEVITGCMFSGKSTELLNRLKNCSEKYILVKPKIDTRYGLNSVSTHSGKKESAIVVSALSEVFQNLNDGLAHNERPYLSTGLRESQLLLVNNDFGFGYANTNMWWGPGLHNSLHMSNNTSGFNYLFLGTTSENK